MYNSKPVLILGDGEHAKVVVDLCLSLNREVIGITSPSQRPGTVFRKGVKVLGDDSILNTLSNVDVELVNGIGSIQNTQARYLIFEKGKNYGFDFAQLLHPTAFVNTSSLLSEGVQVMPGAIITIDSIIEKNVLINTKVSIDHNCRIGAHTHIAPGVTISGGVSIGENCHIGVGSVIIQGVHIGSNCMVAAGSVVTKNMPNHSRIRGVPGRLY